MDIKKIQELIKLVKKTDIGELKVREGDFSISIKNKGCDTVYTTSAIAPQVTQQTQEVREQKSETAAPVAEIKNDNLHVPLANGRYFLP